MAVIGEELNKLLISGQIGPAFFYAQNMLKFSCHPELVSGSTYLDVEINIQHDLLPQ